MSTGSLFLLQPLSGDIIEFNPETGERTSVVSGLGSHPDGIAIDVINKRIYWTNMGEHKEPDTLEFFQADGSVETANLDGSGRKRLVENGVFVTGKQLLHDSDNGHLYWCDREGMRVLRSNDDGSNLTVLIQTGLFPKDARDYTRHCVGIAIDLKNDFIYWTQKGPSKGGKGRIMRASLALPEGKTASTRQDIKPVMENLPEPIDLEFDFHNNLMYWTDRGDKLQGGNTLNCASVQNGEFTDHRILATGLDEGIGLAIDHPRGVIWITDLGGNLWQYKLNSDEPLQRIASFEPLTGIALG
ncbi:hypothetical protein L579_4218 [Pantoea sp. AS-PWVM4]|uniref:hypothetical protein n=1 Tax=Pantoea sp. AS-PWVM4 TaxID=1332069 RepID=UPI0003AC67D6|nr:hypothetical protein [Pantoea sp. AS-PWVM4]ERK16309.1 hypothetical protein L579_4218 [Pantoea sp. AS-PWVM4]